MSSVDFHSSRHSALGEGQKCEQDGCDQQATYFDWHAGAMCDDCVHDNRRAANRGK